jgi:hypothetical protein
MADPVVHWLEPLPSWKILKNCVKIGENLERTPLEPSLNISGHAAPGYVLLLENDQVFADT